MGMTRALYGKVLIPLAFYTAGDFRFKYFERYKDNLKMTRKQVREYQLRRLKALVKHSYETVPYYRELFDKQGLKPEQINSLEDYAKLPILTKLQIRENFDRLKSKKKYKLIEGSSGGSTGNTVHFVKDTRYMQISRAVWMRDLYSIGIHPGDKVAWIWGSPFRDKFSIQDSINRFMWKLQRKSLFNAAKFTSDELDTWLKNDFCRFRPDCVYGYPHLVYAVARHIDENNIKIPPVKKVVCTAERLENREYIEKVFGCPVHDQYGSREILEIAIEGDDGVMRSADDFVLVETLDDGRIILTPLESYGMPFLRYEIGDIGSSKPAAHSGKSSQASFSQLNIDIGRQCELLRDKRGRTVSFASFCSILNRPMSVGQIQLVQKSLDESELRVVPNRDIRKEDLETLIKEIKKKLGCKTVSVKYLDTYPLARSGKRITFVCELK